MLIWSNDQVQIAGHIYVDACMQPMDAVPFMEKKIFKIFILKWLCLLQYDYFNINWCDINMLHAYTCYIDHLTAA